MYIKTTKKLQLATKQPFHPPKPSNNHSHPSKQTHNPTPTNHTPIQKPKSLLQLNSISRSNRHLQQHTLKNPLFPRQFTHNTPNYNP